MIKTFNVLLIFLLFSSPILSQIETVNPHDEVYTFLKILSLKNIISGYEDVVLPLSKRKITFFLNEAYMKQNLTLFEREMIRKELSRFSYTNEILKSELFFNSNHSVDEPHYFFLHTDSTFQFKVNPLIGEKFIYSFREKVGTNLFTFGGFLEGSYNNRIAFHLKIRNGIQTGNKRVSLIDQDVRQSFTFNQTGINYFDKTEGYLRYEDKVFDAEIGRKRILWGYGRERLLISNNAPIFDFLKFGADFDFFKVHFLHGWLVQPPDFIYDSSLSSYKKIKNPKYISIGRFALYPSDFLSFGVTQTIIYANRPVELAYLTPFVFYESAQRSMNDLDNSFLGFDFKLKILRGFEISSQIHFDDLNFDSLHHNRYAFETNLFFSNPLVPENILFQVGIIKIDPYVFSHIGNGEALTFTNNGFLIGPDLQPNSLKLFLDFNLFLTSKIKLQLYVSHIVHGRNLYDNYGYLLENKGGNVFEYFKAGDTMGTRFLSGDREKITELSFAFNYNLIPGFYVLLNYQLQSHNQNNHYFWGGFIYEL